MVNYLEDSEEKIHEWGRKQVLSFLHYRIYECYKEHNLNREVCFYIHDFLNRIPQPWVDKLFENRAAFGYCFVNSTFNLFWTSSKLIDIYVDFGHLLEYPIDLTIEEYNSKGKVENKIYKTYEYIQIDNLINDLAPYLNKIC